MGGAFLGGGKGAGVHLVTLGGCFCSLPLGQPAFLVGTPTNQARPHDGPRISGTCAREKADARRARARVLRACVPQAEAVLAPLLPFLAEALAADDLEGVQPAEVRASSGKRQGAKVAATTGTSGGGGGGGAATAAAAAKSVTGTAARQLPQLVLLLDPELCRWGMGRLGWGVSAFRARLFCVRDIRRKL